MRKAFPFPAVQNGFWTLTSEKGALRLGRERPLRLALARKAPQRKKWKINVQPVFVRFNWVIFLKQNMAPQNTEVSCEWRVLVFKKWR